MSIWSAFWNDEQGAVLSAEVVTIGTVAVLGALSGMHTVSTAINGELNDMARAIRSLDQTYCFQGFSSCRAYTAGSAFTQQAVAESLQSLCAGTVAPVAPVVPSRIDGVTPAPVGPGLTPVPAPTGPRTEAPADPMPTPAQEKFGTTNTVVRPAPHA